MKCMQCENDANAICKFCGDAICKQHRESGRFVSGGVAMGQGSWGRLPKTVSDKIVVPQAAWCGTCKVET